MTEKLQFRFSSATKSILGKDLITDKNIAIFELVKNSYDAYATRVDIHITDTSIIIIDDGDGMSIDDINNKWLYIGYSEKSDKTLEMKRDTKRRTFAGAKGIGRLACDRLGKKLQLTSIKNSKVEQLHVNWGDFEKDSKVDFTKIDISYQPLTTNPYPNLKHGTVLEITELREIWERKDIERIIQHLAKLISPVKENDDEFKIFVHSDGGQEVVENFIFEKLGLKTTQIEVSVSADGAFITTELIDRGDKIYKIIEKNEWSKKIANIKVELFYLSRPTKMSFFHAMKIRTKDFGSVFLYNNGFRVFPYGESGDDSLGIDRRKTQGYARNLGTRELIGNIIIKKGSDEFKETSSRDGGLINTKGYQELKELFFEKALKRLEIYTIETLSWTYNKETEQEFFPKDHKKEIEKLIQKLTKSEGFMKLEYDFSSFEEKIEKKVNEGFQGATGVLKKEALKTGNKQLKEAVKKIEEIQEKQRKTINEQEREIEKSEEEKTALRAFESNPYFKNIVDFHHDISIASGNIDDAISSALRDIKNDEFGNLYSILESIKYENSKILSISKIATRSGVEDGVHKKTMALNKKIASYLEDYNNLYSSLNIEIHKDFHKDFLVSFRFYDIVTVLDNLLDNSKKHKAKNIKVTIESYENNLKVSFFDDGEGLDKKFSNNPNEIFKSRISTTDGAGWGLYQVKEILQEMNGDISVEPQKRGILFNLNFNK